jgi:hypothetical protein
MVVELVGVTVMEAPVPIAVVKFGISYHTIAGGIPYSGS